jgi:hypothetical protein
MRHCHACLAPPWRIRRLCRRGLRWCRVFPGLGAAVVALSQDPLAVSAHYTLHPGAATAAGTMAASAHYQLVASVGMPGGGYAEAAGGLVRDRRGFVAALNDPPRPQADTLSRAPGLPPKIHVTRLLINDADPELEPLRLRRFTALSQQGGRVTYDNGWLLYEPPAGGAAVDAFEYTVEDAAGNAASATVFVLEAAPGLEPSQNLIAVTLLPGGQRRLTFAGIAGRTYALEWSDTLPAARWERLAVLPADDRGLLEWVDATDPPPATRFYRAVAP